MTHCTFMWEVTKHYWEENSWFECYVTKKLHLGSMWLNGRKFPVENNIQSIAKKITIVDRFSFVLFRTIKIREKRYNKWENKKRNVRFNVPSFIWKEKCFWSQELSSTLGKATFHLIHIKQRTSGSTKMFSPNQTLY